MIRRPEVRDRLIVLVILFVAGIQASYILRKPEFAVTPSDDPVRRLLGSACEIVGDLAFLEAEVYFHHGVRREDHHAEPEAVSSDWISRLAREIAYEGHRELGQGKQQEMLPFLVWAVRLSPHNAAAVLSVAYWLERKFGRPAEAEAILEKGARDNPESWEIQFELAKMRYRKKDFAASAPALREAARRHGRAGEDRPTMRELQYYLAESEAALGNRDAAIAAYRATLELFESSETPPLRAKIIEKIRVLEADAG